MMTIKCLYSCNLCGLKKIACEVPARVDGQDVAHWMKEAVVTISEDHAHRSPHCKPKTLSEMYIPMDGTKMIGGPAIQ